MSSESLDPEDKESLARTHLPYRAEYCKTNRAKCKKCGEPMMKDSLKLANMTKSRWHDGYDAAYYHVNCFFRTKRPASVAEIRYFEILKYEDQKMLEEAVETKGASVLGSETIETGAKKKTKKGAVKREAPEKETSGSLVNYEDFILEYAKSSRAKCNLCDQKIEKETVRIAKYDYDVQAVWNAGANAGPVPRWYHDKCFAKSLEKLSFFGQIELVKGFKSLEKDDQKALKKLIKPAAEEAANNIMEAKKAKTDSIKKDPAKLEEEKLLKKQSDRFFALRENVSKMKLKDIQEMLENMDQKSNYKVSSVMIDMATDVLLYGPLEMCPECKKKGGMILRGSSYICTLGPESNPCTYETRDPKRGVPDVPEEICEKYEFFDNFKFRGGKRIFPSKLLEAIEEKEAENNNIVLDGAPLEGLTFGVTSWNALKNEKVTVMKKVSTLGGKIVTAIDGSLFAILSSKFELEKETPKVEVAKALNVPIASDDFLFNIHSKDDVVPQLSKCLINDWKGDLNDRFNRMISTQSGSIESIDSGVATSSSG